LQYESIYHFMKNSWLLLCFLLVFCAKKREINTSKENRVTTTKGQTVLLQNVTIIDVINEKTIVDKTIEIKNGVIQKIHPNTYVGAATDSLIDLNGKFVIPGLTDSHTHIEHSGYGYPNSPRKNLVKLLEHALYGGITNIREMAGDARVVGELSRSAQLNLIASPNIYYPSLFAGKAFFKDKRSEAMALGRVKGRTPWSQIIDSASIIPELIAQAKGNGSVAIKMYALLDPPTVRKITDEAHRQGLGVWSHSDTQLSNTLDLVNNNVDVLSHAGYMIPGKNAVYPKDDKNLQKIFQKMIDKKIILDPTAYLFKIVDYRKNFLALNTKVSIEAYKKGVIIIAGTDTISAYKDVKTPFIHNEIEMYVTEIGMTTMDALKSATINAAIALHIDKKEGSINIAKNASLVVLNSNPIEDIKNTRDIHFVMKDGIIFQRNN